jgi:hypothetical protein
MIQVIADATLLRYLIEIEVVNVLPVPWEIVAAYTQTSGFCSSHYLQ